jgi:hypothetical protein
MGILETALAGLRAELRTVASNMLALAPTTDLFLAQALSPPLAFDQWQLGRALAIWNSGSNAKKTSLIRRR